MNTSTRRIFGTDGVRGCANRSPMDSETALKLGQAAGVVFRKGKHRHRIVIGKDTRVSGYMLETALSSGICSMGVDVMLVGPLPTPGIAFITRSMRADAGVVISASHNPYHDNGIKFFDRDGFKLPDELELEIENLVFSNFEGISRPEGSEIGKACRIDDAQGRYIQYLKTTFPRGFLLDGMRIVIDCSNGSGYKVGPAVFSELGAEVIAIGNKPDGKNINKGCGSLEPGLLSETVKKSSADVGIALDGDADRVIMCDEHGNVVDGDVILALCAAELNKKGCLKKNTIVATVMSNFALDEAMARQGVGVVRTKVGDRYVIRCMRENGYTLGGEQSGHIVFLEHNTTGDGILGALQVVSMMCETNKPLSKLKNVFEPYPQVQVNIPVKKKQDFATIPELASLINRCETDLGKTGRLLLRYSGTENIARILLEGKDSQKISKWLDEFASLIGHRLGGV